MTTPSSSIPYRYPSQPQDPRVPVQHPYQQPTASTSTASAFAYAQQQQQLANRQSQSQPNSGASSYIPYVPSPIRRQTVSQPRRPSPLADRPHSISELARIAAQDKYDRFGDIKQDLRYAEVYLTEGKKDMEAGDLEWAFVHFARTATLVLERIPTNSHYQEMKESHRATLAHNGNFCLERMSEIKPTLVDRYELWRQRYPNVKPELDMPRMLSAMAVRDNEELAIRAQASKMKRAANKEETMRRTQAEEGKRRQEELKRWEEQQAGHEEEARQRAEAARQKQVYDAASRQAYEDARRRHEEAKQKEADTEEAKRREEERAQMEAVAERRRREAEEEGRRREEEIARRKLEEAQRQEQTSRQEQEAVTRRKMEELEYRRQKDEVRRRELEDTRRREQDGIIQRQREAEAEAKASRSLLQVQVPVPDPPPPSSSSSSSSRTAQTLTPRQQDGLPVLPLESPTRAESLDPRNGRHHPQPQHATMPDRAIGRTNAFHSPITTTSPPPKERPALLNWMTDHQRAQGYTPSLQSMFSAPITGPPTGLLFSPNHPEGPSAKNMPTSPDRPPAHIRHMWEMAGYGPQFSHSEKPKPKLSQADSRILRPEEVRRDEAATVFQAELKIVKVPQDILPRFLDVAAVNTARNKETCGLLMGREDGKEYRVVTLLIPRQRATSDTCTMEEEELVSEFAEKRKMMTLGWIHTHPTQSCFMSSLDLHTHAGFQSMLPEFFAVVCAPRQVPNCGVFRLTDPPGLKTILKCTEKASFHPHAEVPIYTDADKGHVVWAEDTVSEIVDLR